MRLFLTALLCAAACVLARPLAGCVHQFVGHLAVGGSSGGHLDRVFVELYGPERHDVFFANNYPAPVGYRLAGYGCVILVSLALAFACRLVFQPALKLALWAGTGFALCDALVRVAFECFHGSGDIGELLPWWTDQTVIHYGLGALFAVLAVTAADAWLRHLLLGAWSTCGELRTGRRLLFLGLFALLVVGLQVPAVFVPVRGLPQLYELQPREWLETGFRLGLVPCVLLLLGMRQRVTGLAEPRPLATAVPLSLALLAAGACAASQWFLAAGVRV